MAVHNNIAIIKIQRVGPLEDCAAPGLDSPTYCTPACSNCLLAESSTPSSRQPSRLGSALAVCAVLSWTHQHASCASSVEFVSSIPYAYTCEFSSELINAPHKQCPMLTRTAPTAVSVLIGDLFGQPRGRRVASKWHGNALSTTLPTFSAQPWLAEQVQSTCVLPVRRHAKHLDLWVNAALCNRARTLLTMTVHRAQIRTRPMQQSALLWRAANSV